MGALHSPVTQVIAVAVHGERFIAPLRAKVPAVYRRARARGCKGVVGRVSGVKTREQWCRHFSSLSPRGAPRVLNQQQTATHA